MRIHPTCNYLQLLIFFGKVIIFKISLSITEKLTSVKHYYLYNVKRQTVTINYFYEYFEAHCNTDT